MYPRLEEFLRVNFGSTRVHNSRVTWRDASDWLVGEVEDAFAQPQNVVVFGGSSDIARALTKKLCAARARTVVLAGRVQHFSTTQPTRPPSMAQRGSVRFSWMPEGPEHAAVTVSEAFEKVGDPVDLVVMAVGLLGVQANDEDDAVAVARLITVNFAWPGAALAEIRRLLVAQGSGRILVISSFAAVRAHRHSLSLRERQGGARQHVSRSRTVARRNGRDAADPSTGRRANEDDSGSRGATIYNRSRRSSNQRDARTRDRERRNLEPANSSLRGLSDSPPPTVALATSGRVASDDTEESCGGMSRCRTKVGFSSR